MSTTGKGLVLVVEDDRSIADLLRLYLARAGYGVHVEMVRGFDGSNTLTWGGNTSPGSSGSQSNGGGAYKRTRSPGEVRGYALVDYPG